MFTRTRLLLASALVALFAACSSAPPPPPPTQVQINSSPISCQVGSPCTETITGTGGLQANYAWSTTTATPGFLTFAPSGANFVFQGTATTQDYEAAGPTHAYTFTVSLTDLNTTATAQITVTLTAPNGEQPPTISGSPATSALVGVAYDFVPAAVSSNPPLTFSATGLPSWLNINSSTGELTGTPTQAETDSNIVLTVTDVFGSTASLAAFTITVTQPVPPVLSGPQGGASPSAAVGQMYSVIPTVSDQLGRVWSYSVANLPIWANFNASTGAITGTPIYALLNQSNNVSITATNGSTTIGPFTFTVTVTAPLPGYTTFQPAPVSGDTNNDTLIPVVNFSPTVLNSQYNGGSNAFVSMSIDNTNHAFSEQLLIGAATNNPTPIQLNCGGLGVSCGTLSYTPGSLPTPTVVSFAGSNPCTVNPGYTGGGSPRFLTLPAAPSTAFVPNALFICTIDDSNGAPADTWEVSYTAYPYNGNAIDLSVTANEYTAPLHQLVQTMTMDYSVNSGAGHLIGLTQINANGASAGVPTYFHN